jgi:hypothetical protein
MQLRCTLLDGAFDPHFLRGGWGGAIRRQIIDVGSLNSSRKRQI